MSTDLTVILEHQPGELARLGEVTGEAGVSIRGLAAFTGDGRGVVRVLLDGEAVPRCRAALGRAGIWEGIADEREVLVVDVEDRPMALGELTRQLADANVNVDLVLAVNRILRLTWDFRGCQAARVYSLIRPLRTGFRWTRWALRSVAMVRGASSSLSGVRWSMPW
jgi:hypothetical protein